MQMVLTGCWAWAAMARESLFNVDVQKSACLELQMFWSLAGADCQAAPVQALQSAGHAGTRS